MHGKMYSARPPPQLSDSNRRIIDSNGGTTKRVYQLWKGSNRFFLGGRIIFGPDARSLIFTVSLIAIPVILFCSFDSQRLINEFQHSLGSLIIAIPVILTIHIMVLLFLTSGRDPGIIPRNPHPPEPEDEGGPSSLSNDWSRNQGSTSGLPPTKDVLVNGIAVKVKYCHTCMLYRPPRCSHCSICNNCVERFDHHCPWVGQCIGKRNYRFFFMFVSSTTILCLYVFAFCWVNIRFIMEMYHYNVWKALLKSPVSGVLILYTFITSWFVGGLTVFHLYLICTNQTTYENFRYRYDRKMNPYNLGVLHNIGEVFFSMIPSSKNNFRAKVTEGSSCSNFGTSLSMGHHHGSTPGLEMPKRSFDVEMGGKRQGVVDEEFDDIHGQIDGIGSLERCEPQPRHTNWGGHKGNNWEMSPDVHALAAEFGMNQDDLPKRQKINGGLEV
ncbi:probable protein S-acyltransferase 7 [Papaver somniferum]|uniref:probable protein S-acyltransferase 7 n=1 Tax=Papaver somniferum TaxID=3469 RepID=UPI000E6FB504|nr:probable protein S-acyltransferase 7 [Papaver somniferum]